MKKRIKSVLNGIRSSALIRVATVVLMLLLQLTLLVVLSLRYSEFTLIYYLLTSISGLIIALTILNNESNPAYKLAWIIPILFLPIFGALIYLIFGREHISSRMKTALTDVENKVFTDRGKSRKVIGHVMEENEDAALQMRYLNHVAFCPAYDNTAVDFLSPGEVKFERLKVELKKAKSFIFIEYFIIGSGIMWDGVLEILLEKVRQGVEVRVMYDDFGSIITLPYRYERTLRELGIQCCVFNKVTPILSTLLNNRDHRKIVVIDGKVGFTGGVNIADEYINHIDKHGHWKDASIVMEGEAVWSLTAMFLVTWGVSANIKEDINRYRVEQHPIIRRNLGVVQPYFDSPLDSEQVGENVYLNMIARAKKYLYIESPYLVIDQEMIVALCNAARQGVDVRIVTPYKGDHWYVHAVTRSNYKVLVRAGVKIYEYTPGFIHSKVFVCDDVLATVGTVNMDYRSLYLHFECGVLLYKAPVIRSIYNDFMEIINVSQPVTLEQCLRVPWYRRFAWAALKYFAPLM